MAGLLVALALPLSVASPAGAAPTWTVTNIGTAAVYSISCTSPSSCAAVDTDGNILTFNGGSWTATAVGTAPDNGSHGGLDNIGCVSQFCVASTVYGFVYQGLTSTSPSTWSLVNFDTTLINSVACVSADECYAADANGDIYQGGAGGWTSTPDRIDEASASGGGVGAISCLHDQDYCVAVDSLGNVLTMTGAGSWTNPQPIDPSGGGLWSISCTSKTFCVTADADGNVLSWNGSSWSTTALTSSADPINSVSCTSSSFCVAVDSDGNAWIWNGTGWSSDDVDGSTYLWSVSCPSAASCLVGDTAGNVATFSNPLGITTASLPAASVGTPYSTTLAASGGDGQYTWSVNGSLPRGLSLDPSTGVISGTPTAPYSGALTLAVSDASGDGPVSSALALDVVGDQNVTFTTAAPTNAVVGATYAPAATASSGLPVSLAIDSSSTPGACDLAAGIVSFTGNGTCVVQATSAGDAEWKAASATQSISVSTASPPTASPSTASSPTTGTPTASSPTASAPHVLPVVTPPPAATQRSALELVKSRATTIPRATLERSRGRISVRVSCTGSPCSGSISLSVARYRRARVVHVVVASGRYSLAKGHKTTTVLKLSRRGHEILAHWRRAKTWRTTATIDNDGAVTHRPLVVKWPGR